MTTVTQSVPSQIARQEQERFIQEISEGIDISNLKLTKFRNAKYMGIIADEKGQILFTEDPDFGTRIPVIFTGKTGWYVVDEAAAKMASIPNAKKMMLFAWDAQQSMYVLSRTKYDKSGVAFGDKGLMEQYAERHGSVVQKSIVPGVEQLDWLVKTVKEHSQNIKKDKGKEPSRAASDVTKGWSDYCKALGYDKTKALHLLRQSWPELFEK